jgi:hypothetical protein
MQKIKAYLTAQIPVFPENEHLKHIELARWRVWLGVYY